MAQAGIQSVDVVCPGFTGDCLETLEEISMEAREAFLHAGGKGFQYIPCLNDEPTWIDALTSICEQHMQGWPTSAQAMQLQATTSAQTKELALALGAKE
jgi:ferrochelatase